jgi:hypothetical protein
MAKLPNLTRHVSWFTGVLLLWFMILYPFGVNDDPSDPPSRIIGFLIPKMHSVRKVRLCRLPFLYSTVHITSGNPFIYCT